MSLIPYMILNFLFLFNMKLKFPVGLSLVEIIQENNQHHWSIVLMFGYFKLSVYKISDRSCQYAGNSQEKKRNM